MKKLLLLTLLACGFMLGANANPHANTTTNANANANPHASSKIMDALRDSKGEVVTDFSQNAFSIKGIHKKLDLKCSDCHLEKDPKDYSSAMNKSCLKCHGTYEQLREYTGGLGHDLNIHAGPHYEALDCDNCHKSHSDEKPINMCSRCHNQESMKKLMPK
ncbi:cytochrome c3 family protein [Helicobacter sp. 11S02629-2]|uniref:cytochrome c3 family protein n=1 Tax=Helicobacter sp. 11S02629-2 TaxID=1476195 RepID=UPI000BCDC5EE|nr:cytochrome c3 family protein [Helicobacter sp. 11S02629-2]PAF44365.1 hypothetical protein BKH40_05575 [Helicobacter sp. 11S02629-2]